MAMLLTATLLLAAIAAAPCTASAEGPGASSLAVAVLQASGLDEQIEHIAEEAVLGVEPGGPGFPAEALRAMQEAAAQAYAPDRLKEFIRHRLERDLDPETSRAALDWWRSETGLRIAAAERAGAGPYAVLEQESFEEALEQRPPAPGRLALIGRIDAATRATETDLDVALFTGLGAALSGPPLGAGGAPPVWTELEEQLRIQRRELEPLFREAVQENLLFLYRGLSDEDLERFAHFAESDFGRRYHGIVGTALRDALIRAGLDLASRLPRVAPRPAPSATSVRTRRSRKGLRARKAFCGREGLSV